MAIRMAVPADADTVFGLLTRFATSYRPTRPDFDRCYPEVINDLLVATINDNNRKPVVGYALSVQFVVLFASGPIVELQELMVDPDHRSRGVGARLVDGVIGRARAAGAKEVTVPTRRAVDYYRRLGFQETATYLKLSIS